MNGITLTLRSLHHGENHLAEELLKVAERHRTEHEVHHVGRDMARWSQEHSRRLAEAAEAYGVRLSDPPEGTGVLGRLREKASEAMGHRPEPALLLLHDLRELHLAAAENSLTWEMLAQAAQAGKDERLLELASSCHPETLRQMRWTNTLIKELSPQALTSV